MQYSDFYLLNLKSIMSNRLILYLVLFILLFSSCASHTNKKTEEPGDIEFTILQLNLWVECTKVENGSQYLVNQITYLQPDIATFCELYKGENDNQIIPQLIQSLAAKGINYYSAQVDGRAVISKYPIIDKVRINKWMFKAVLNIDGKRVAVYPAHSEYRYYACYYPRGYNDGQENWNELPAPVTDVKKILSVNRQSGRVESTQAFIADANEEIRKGALVFFAGDFNEPSHLDWQKDTKDLRDHCGCIVDWDVSKLLYSNSFKDAYREKYPDAVKYPGFTFPADNRNVDVNQLTWAPKADERERIDFIYYFPQNNLFLENVRVAGPSSSIVRAERIEENSKDIFISNGKSGWPSDHKGVLATFRLRK